MTKQTKLEEPSYRRSRPDRPLTYYEKSERQKRAENRYRAKQRLRQAQEQTVSKKDMVQTGLLNGEDTERDT